MEGAQATLGRQYVATGTGTITPATPRPIGLIDRITGLESGLGELSNMIEAFTAKTVGLGGKHAGQGPQPIGFLGSISGAEQNLRRCIDMMRQLHDAF